MLLWRSSTNKHSFITFVRIMSSTSECIYNLIRKDQLRSAENEKYNCKFREKIRQQARRGQIKTDVSQQALGKPIVSKIHCLASERKPPVPVHNIQTKKQTELKNFCRENVQRMGEMQPSDPIHRTVETKSGKVITLENSGLLPKYIHKKNFGSVPNYIKQRKEEEMAQRLRIEAQERERKKGPNTLTSQERSKILEGLRQNWKEKQREFELLPVVTDTLPKKQRRIKLEKELRQLEHDIALLEKHPTVILGN